VAELSGCDGAIYIRQYSCTAAFTKSRVTAVLGYKYTLPRFRRQFQIDLGEMMSEAETSDPTLIKFVGAVDLDNPSQT
jgi:hypothetical protein